MGNDLILEIGCEEIPARFLGPSLERLRDKTAAALDKARLSRGEIETLGTPRRLAVIVRDLAEAQENWEEKKTGPLLKQAFAEDGSPTKAAIGFARSCGASVEELGREDSPKGEKLVFVKKVEGRKAGQVLPELLPEIISSLEFPKSMRWGKGEMTFARPIHWILAMLGDKTVSLELGGLQSGNSSRGHRFTHPDPFSVKGAGDYVSSLMERDVLVDPAARREIIVREASKKAKELGGELAPDPGLIGEVSNLVERPVVIAGKFDDKYLSLPPEVTVSCMRTHQKYFAVRKPGSEKELLPYFIAVANTPAKDMGVIVKGNERVLEARLADAEFYWDEDLKTGLERMKEKTSGMVFFKTLGSYADKMERTAKICERLALELFPDDASIRDAAVKAAQYSKADLVSQMVGEFPELQGVMGGEYALAAGLDRDAAEAIRDQYLPRSAEDVAQGNYALTPAGDALSAADKIDSLVACWAAGLAPSGSGDPFALRRQAQGVVNLILAKGYAANLAGLVELAAGLLPEGLKIAGEELAKQVLDFILTRVRVQLIESGYAYDVVDACLAVFNGDLVTTMQKIEAVSRLKEREDFDDLMLAFRRVMNIIEGQPGMVESDAFEHQSEAVLYSEYTRVQIRVEPLLSVGKYDDALEFMASLKPAVDKFFDDVMVNVDDERLRRNRHAICSVIASLFKEVADFSLIVVQGDKAGGG